MGCSPAYLSSFGVKSDILFSCLARISIKSTQAIVYPAREYQVVVAVAVLVLVLVVVVAVVVVGMVVAVVVVVVVMFVVVCCFFLLLLLLLLWSWSWSSLFCSLFGKICKTLHFRWVRVPTKQGSCSSLATVCTLWQGAPWHAITWPLLQEGGM